MTPSTHYLNSKSNKRLDERRESVEPQNNDEDDGDSNVNRNPPPAKATEDYLKAKRPPLVVKAPRRGSIHQFDKTSNDAGSLPSVLVSLDTVCALSRQISAQQPPNDVSLPRSRRLPPYVATSLANLYVKRASTLLEYVKYDALATIPLTLFTAIDSTIDVDCGLFHGCDKDSELAAVEQALDDALAAISLDSHLPEAYVVAARCSRSLNKSPNAMEFVAHALQLAPLNADALTLMKQLQVDLDESRHEFAPPLLCRSATGDDLDQQQQEEDENEGIQDVDDLDTDLHTRFQAMAALASSPLLSSMEQMAHECIHHTCASNDEVKALRIAFDQTVELLRLVLQDATHTSQAILLEAHELETIARQLTCADVVSQTPSIRKWIVKTLAPAVVQSIPDEMDSFYPGGYRVGCTLGSRAAMLRDILLTITRLLLATGNLQRCTVMPHTLSSIKMAYDLSKQLAGDTSYTALPQTRSSVFSRLEMVCADAYAVALLDLTEEAGEALLLHQESLELAMKDKDTARTLRCHYLVGRALFRIREFEVARTEFRELLHKAQVYHDTSMECLAWFHLGEYFIAVGDVDEAMDHFDKAIVLSNQSGQCRGTWREQSLADAIAFYACMRPTRRRAITRDVLTVQKREDVSLRYAAEQAEDEDDWAWPEDEEDSGDEIPIQPVVVDRRATVWMTSTTRQSSKSGGSAVVPILDNASSRDNEDCIPTPSRTSLMGRLFGQTPCTSTAMNSPTRPACWKPKE